MKREARGKVRRRWSRFYDAVYACRACDRAYRHGGDFCEKHVAVREKIVVAEKAIERKAVKK